MLQLGVTLGTAVSEAPAQATEVFASIEHAREGVVALAGAAARAAAGGYASTMRLQAMMGEVRPGAQLALALLRCAAQQSLSLRACQRDGLPRRAADP